MNETEQIMCITLKWCSKFKKLYFISSIKANIFIQNLTSGRAELWNLKSLHNMFFSHLFTSRCKPQYVTSSIVNKTQGLRDNLNADKIIMQICVGYYVIGLCRG